MLLRVEDISAFYGRVAAIHGVSLEVGDGEVVCLLGANGAGKTTTLMAICGVNTPATGQIHFDGRRIDRLPAHKIARLGIAQVPEGRRIYVDLTVEENLEMGTYGRRSRDSGEGHAGRGEGRAGAEWKSDLDLVYQMFPRLAERRMQLGATLSGGEQQMLAIGRALIARPRLLLLDEPSLGLAPKMVDLIYETIAKVQKLGMTILLVEQNVDIASRFADRAYVLESGTLIASGSPEALVADARVREAYLGGD